MDQFELNSLFERFDKALGVGRKPSDPKRLRANSFMLISINGGICTFQHKATKLQVRFDTKKQALV